MKSEESIHALIDLDVLDTVCTELLFVVRVNQQCGTPQLQVFLDYLGNVASKERFRVLRMEKDLCLKDRVGTLKLGGGLHFAGGCWAIRLERPPKGRTCGCV